MAECVGLAVIGGPVWQWDLGREVAVTGAEPGDLVDVARAGTRMALTVAVSDRAAPIPNALTKCPGRLGMWLRRGNSTVAALSVAVLPRAEPDDYEYVETPTVGYQALRAEMLERLGAIDAALPTAGLVKRVEAPLSVSADGTLTVDVGAVGRGTQITVGDEPPTTGVLPGDSFIRTTDMALLVAREG